MSTKITVAQCTCSAKSSTEDISSSSLKYELHYFGHMFSMCFPSPRSNVITCEKKVPFVYKVYLSSHLFCYALYLDVFCFNLFFLLVSLVKESTLMGANELWFWTDVDLKSASFLGTYVWRYLICYTFIQIILNNFLNKIPLYFYLKQTCSRK